MDKFNLAAQEFFFSPVVILLESANSRNIFTLINNIQLKKQEYKKEEKDIKKRGKIERKRGKRGKRENKQDASYLPLLVLNCGRGVYFPLFKT